MARRGKSSKATSWGPAAISPRPRSWTSSWQTAGNMWPRSSNRPWQRGKVVLTDRYYYSSVAYQGALGLDPHDILAANEAFAPVPDLVFILELPVTEALARLAKKGKAARQVSESFPYLKRVEAVYASLKGPRFRRLDASGPPMEVHALILEEVRKSLRKRPERAGPPGRPFPGGRR